MGQVFAHIVALEGDKLGEIWQDDRLRFEAVFDLPRIPVLNIGNNLQETNMTDDDSQHRLNDWLLVCHINEVVSCQ